MKIKIATSMSVYNYQLPPSADKSGLQFDKTTCATYIYDGGFLGIGEGIGVISRWSPGSTRNVARLSCVDPEIFPRRVHRSEK